MGVDIRRPHPRENDIRGHAPGLPGCVPETPAEGRKIQLRPADLSEKTGAPGSVAPRGHRTYRLGWAGLIVI
jgi:hypothetical protein